MKFTRELPANTNLIRSYDSTGIRIGEQTVRGSILVSATQLLVDWPPTSTATLTLAHFDAALAWQPEIILLGTGPRQAFPSREIHAAILKRGIGFEVMDTGAACRTYNVLVGEQRRVVAGLLL